MTLGRGVSIESSLGGMVNQRSEAATSAPVLASGVHAARGPAEVQIQGGIELIIVNGHWMSLNSAPGTACQPYLRPHNEREREREKEKHMA